MHFSIDDIIKRPNLYFVILLGIALIWASASALVLHPRARGELDNRLATSKQIQEYCKEIFELEPTRLTYAEIRTDVGEFSFTSAIDKTATQYGIRPADYDIRTERVRRQRTGSTQGATITIQSVNMTNFAGFLSELLEIWPDLKCDNIRLNQNQDKPDDWRAVVRFTYTMP